MWDRIKNWWSNFMSGRYGMDSLNQFLFVVFFVLFFIELFAKGIIASICNWLSLIVLILMYFRMFSRDHYARSAENTKYNEIRDRITGFFRGGRSGSRGSSSTDRDHKIFVCPQCGQKVRVPRGRGKVQIRCPKCGRQFIKRT